MTNRDIKKILNCPSRVTLNLVLDLVNLKDRELKAITLMDIKGNTREETAEMMNKYVGKKMRKKSKADREELIASLEKEMKQAARVLDFERAAQLRDMIMEIKSDGD